MMNGNPEEAFADIMNAIARLRIAFLKHNLSAPISIEIGSLRDGDALRHLMPRDMFLAQPRMGETKQDAEWVANIQGVEIRMPAQWRRELNGKTHLV
jgi:hypothetical protein